MPTADSLGAQGERAVRRYLEAEGFVIVEANWRCRYGEVDLICRDGSCLVFVEVKTRRSRQYGYGVEAVDERKRAHIRSVAEHYLFHTRQLESDCRFDVVVVEFVCGLPQTHHYRAAF